MSNPAKFPAAYLKGYLLGRLSRTRDDSLERVEYVFKYCTAEQMQQQFGQSGLTRQQLLDDYREERARYNAAIAWLESVQT